MMDQDSNSRQLRKANKLLRSRLKPMLRFVSSQRFLNWITHQQPIHTGAPFDGAVCEWVPLEHQGRAIRSLKVTPKIQNTTHSCILYFHGGAYTLGSPAASEAEARRFAIRCGMPVFSAQYTTAIHSPYPAAVDDAETAYAALLGMGYTGDQIVLAGTSAGGGLALALLHRLIDKRADQPSCSVTLSPWVDLTMSQPSIEKLAEADVILSRAWLARAARMYAGSSARVTPEISPLFGHFAGGPPHMIFCSHVEILRDEIVAFAEELETCEVAVDLMTHKHAPHAWPIMAESAPESAQAFDAIADFVAAHCQ